MGDSFLGGVIVGVGLMVPRLSLLYCVVSYVSLSLFLSLSLFMCVCLTHVCDGSKNAPVT